MYIRYTKKYITKRLIGRKTRITNVDFKLALDFKGSQIMRAQGTKWQCITSKSIYYFYVPLMLLIGVVLILKFQGVMM